MTPVIVGLMFAAVLVTGCKKPGADKPTESPAAPSADPAGNETPEGHAALVESAKKKLDELEAQTAELRRKIAEKSGQWSDEARKRWQESLEELEAQKEEARGHWEKLKEKSGTVWQDAQEGFDAAVGQAKETYQKIKQKLSGPEGAPEPAPEKPE